MIIFLFLAPASGWGADDGVDFLSDDFYADTTGEPDIPDPLEPVNRAIFTFNDKAYFWLLKPVATGYQAVMPADIRMTFDRFINNLQEPVRFVNCLLQGRFGDAGSVLLRFLLNSTIGVLGLDDFASREVGLQPVFATLGQTLGSWGIGDGMYLVVPFFGSTTLRDFGGTVVDGLAMTPYYVYIDQWETRVSIYVGKEINVLSMHLGEYEEMKKLSFDPYVALRNGYFQYRRRLFERDRFNNSADATP